MTEPIEEYYDADVAKLNALARKSAERADELGNERHKAVCRLRGFEPCIGGKPTEEASKLIRCIIGREDCHVACVNDLEEARDRLIYLLGADTILKEDGDGMARGDFERGTVPCDSVGARDVPEEAVVDECNFSTPESDMDAEDAGQNPAETQEESSDYVSLGTQPITSEQREYADDYCYRGHFEAFKNTAYSMPWDNPAETSEDASDHVAQGTGPQNLSCGEKKALPNIWYDVMEHEFLITTSVEAPTDHSVNLQDAIDSILRKTGLVEAPETPETVEYRQKPTEKGTIDAPIASITGELRKFAETFRYEWYDEKDGSVWYTTSDYPPTIDSVNGADYINAIADRIDAKHAELRRKLEAVKGIVDGS